jgi:hypothetical protein
MIRILPWTAGVAKGENDCGLHHTFRREGMLNFTGSVDFSDWAEFSDANWRHKSLAGNLLKILAGSGEISQEFQG